METNTKYSTNWYETCCLFQVNDFPRSNDVFKRLRRCTIFTLMTIFVISGCGSESGNSSIPGVSTIKSPGTNNSQTNSATQNPLAPPLSTAGTGSGGGGYDDGAKLLIEASKKFLSSFILNASPVHFEEFPEGWDQERLVEVINNLEFSGDYRTRDDEDLLFDFDEENFKLFYTKKFADKYGQNKFTFALNGNLQELKEISLHILHELSHLLGVGKSKETNNQSAVFAVSFMDSLLTETRVCTDKKENESEETDDSETEENKGSFIFAMNPPTGMMYIRSSEKAPIDTSFLVVGVTDGYNDFEWSLGNPFGFFDLFSYSSLADTAYLTAVGDSKDFSGHADHSPLDLIYSLSYDKNFEESSVFFMKKQNEQPYVSDEGVVTYEEGEFVGNIKNVQEFYLSETELTYKNDSSDPAQHEENINIVLQCSSYVAPIRLNKIASLDFSGKSFSEVANNFMLETSLQRMFDFADCKNTAANTTGVTTRDEGFKNIVCNGLRTKVEEVAKDGK